MQSVVQVPKEIPILTLEKKVILPGGVARLAFAADSSNGTLAEVEFWNGTERRVVGLFPLTKNGEVNEIGTAAQVMKIARQRRSNTVVYSLLVESLCRIKIETMVPVGAYFAAKVIQMDRVSLTEIPSPQSDSAALIEKFKTVALALIELLERRLPMISRLKGLMNRTDSHLLCDLMLMAIDTSFSERLAILNMVNLEDRFTAGLQLLERQLLVLKMASQVSDQLEVREGKSKKLSLVPSSGSRQPPGSHKEKGGSSMARNESTSQRLERLVSALQLPEEVAVASQRSLQKIKSMERQQMLGPEHQKEVAWLEWIVELPWATSTSREETLSLSSARQRLDHDHYGLNKIKRRILEYVAVRLLNPGTKGTILCFVGPPGVGKTSLGRSIATTLGRAFCRVSLGGIRDESDVRGFNKTYVGSQPGRIIHALKSAKTNDPVLLLDEIDKISHNGGNGNPASALLEVLDPAQNSTFVDHYIGVPFDLSKIVFIATANRVDTIPAPLLDRMEVIRIPGYTLEEKVNIATKYIVPRQMEEHGISKEELKIPEDIIVALGQKYTREAGVRNLERKVAALCRDAAVKMVEQGVITTTPGASSAQNDQQNDKNEGTSAPSYDSTDASSAAALAGPPPARISQIVIDEEKLVDILGPPTFDRDDDPTKRLNSPGVVMGLAASDLGGSVLFIEATKMPGSGKIRLTGKLGDVIQESAHIALTWIRSHSYQAGLLKDAVQKDVLDNTDIHIHFPEGAVGKDGPSAGVALITVLVSLLSGCRARSDTAMTGEVTLSGAVLPVGGISQKVLAAHRLGLKRVVMPRQNYDRDLTEISKTVRDSVEFIPVDVITDALPNTILGGFEFLPPAHQPGSSREQSKL